MEIVILLGAPGSGKGTVASRLAAADAALKHVSSGDLLRDAVKRQTLAGVAAEGYMKRGELVPDAIIGRMIADLMAEIEGKCTLLLDGFPRTVAQAQILDRTVASGGASLKAAVLLEVGEDVLVARIAGRRNCPKCGAGYNVTTLPPKVPGICDNCGTKLVVRKDDNPETVKTRLTVYTRQTMPLITFYKTRGLLRTVKADGPLKKTVEQVRQAFA